MALGSWNERYTDLTATAKLDEDKLERILNQVDRSGRRVSAPISELSDSYLRRFVIDSTTFGRGDTEYAQVSAEEWQRVFDRAYTIMRDQGFKLMHAVGDMWIRGKRDDFSYYSFDSEGEAGSKKEDDWPSQEEEFLTPEDHERYQDLTATASLDEDELVRIVDQTDGRNLDKPGSGLIEIPGAYFRSYVARATTTEGGDTEYAQAPAEDWKEIFNHAYRIMRDKGFELIAHPQNNFEGWIREGAKPSIISSDSSDWVNAESIGDYGALDNPTSTPEPQVAEPEPDRNDLPF